MAAKHLALLLGICAAVGCGSDETKPPPATGGDAGEDTSPTPDSGDPPDDVSVSQDSASGDSSTVRDSSFVPPDGAFTSCPPNRDDIPGNRQACEFSRFCWEFRDHNLTKAGDCVNCRNISSDGKPGVYHLGGCWRNDTVGGCSELTSGGQTVTFYYPESTCGEVSVCTSAEVMAGCKAPKTYVPPGG